MTPQTDYKYQRTRKTSDKRTYSVQDILIRDNDEEEDKIVTGIMPITVYPEVTPDISSSYVHKQSNPYYAKAILMDLLCKMPLNIREWILVILLIISGITIIALLALVQANQRPYKDIQCYTNTTVVNSQVYGVQKTYHGAHEAGACELPESYYVVQYPVALGTIESLKHLKFRPELCGHVLQIDCGNGPLDVVVMNSNYGGGLDLYASTWKKLTNDTSPRVISCSAHLTSRNPFSFDAPRCYYKPNSGFDNPYYRAVGLLNTKGRIVSSATINNRSGEHQGDNYLLVFNIGPISVDEQLVFTFEDGETHAVHLRDCEYPKNREVWT